MTDYELEQRLRAWYRDEVGFSETAPAALRLNLQEVTAAPTGWFGIEPWLRARRVVALALVVVLTLIAAAALLVLSQPRPDPPPLPPSSINLWMVIQNDRLTPVDYVMTGSDAGGGGVGGCAVSVSSNVMTSPWAVHIGGQPVLTSDQPAAAYGGLPAGADVVIRIHAPAEGALEVSAVQPGTGLDTDQSTPDACAGFIQPPAGLEVPPAFSGLWRTQVRATEPIGPALYHVYLLSGSVENQSEGSGTVQYIQGAITSVDATEIVFGPSAVCPADGDYGWEMTDGQSILRLSAQQDECLERRALFSADLERVLDGVLLANVRHIARDFGRPLALTIPAELATTDGNDPGQTYSRGEGYAFYRITGFGVEIDSQANTTPAACNGREGWLTGGGPDEPDFVVPEPIRTLTEFRDAFGAWDRAHPDATARPPQDITIGGQPAIMVEVAAEATCENEPGLVAGNILERDFAIDVGGRLLIIATGPGVFLNEGLIDPDTHEAQTYDPSLFTIGDQLVRSLELL